MALEHLIMMRHAKSSWGANVTSDHERPLNGRGRAAAAAIGGVLTAKGLIPDYIWSSDSARTRETAARLFIKPPALQTEFLPEFYHASANKVLYVCAQKGEPDGKVLMLIGHNPGWEDLFCHFTNIPRRVPTGACALYKRKNSQSDWLDPTAWHLTDYILPRDLET